MKVVKYKFHMLTRTCTHILRENKKEMMTEDKGKQDGKQSND